MKKFDYDVVVIGGGAAGKSAALVAAATGQKVAVVESGEWGGTNVNRRDVPYMAASTVSRTFHGAVEGSRFGISSSTLRFNYPTVTSWIDAAKNRAGADDKKDLEESNITCISGYASFISANEISVSGTENIRAKKFIITTGTTPANPGITGIESSACMLPEEVFMMPRIPKVVMVVGAGATGCEIAEYLAEMGAQVLLSEISERILPKEDPEAGEVIEARLTNTLGVTVLTQSRVLAVQDGGTQILNTGRRAKVSKVTFIRGGQEKSVRVEAVVLATGSTPMVDLGLENAGVKYSNKGIFVNELMQTSAKNIYAAGDVAKIKAEKKKDIPEISSTELATYEGAVAGSNSLGKTKTTVDLRGFVRMTDTYPAVACLGLTEDECIVRDKKCSQILIPIGQISAANTSDFQDGFVKILVSGGKERKIMGATIVAPEAASMMQELSLAVRLNASLMDIASTPHVSNGWCEAVKIAARRLAK